MILVDVYVPSLDDTFDFMLDENTEIDKVILEISEMINKKVNSKSKIIASEFMLCWLDNKCVLDSKRTLQSSGVIDGCKLMLI